MTEILKDGFSTTINVAGTTFIEKTLTPPGISAGGAIDTTNMRNTAWRTKRPKSILELLDSGISVQWDPAAYTAIIADLRVNQEIIITFPDGDILTFYGWLDTFDSGEMQEGEEPLADITIIASNTDSTEGTTFGDETAPKETLFVDIV